MNIHFALTVPPRLFSMRIELALMATVARPSVPVVPFRFVAVTTSVRDPSCDRRTAGDDGVRYMMKAATPPCSDQKKKAPASVPAGIGS